MRFHEILARVGLQGDPGLDVLHPPAESRTSHSNSTLNTPNPRWPPLLTRLVIGTVAAIASAIVVYLAIPGIKDRISPPRQILAIQPFKTLGGDPDARRLAEIVREEIFT